MFDQTDFRPIFEATREFLHFVLFDPRSPPAAESLTEETARKFGAAHGVGDRAAGRVIFALVLFAIDRKGADLLELQHKLLAAAAGRRDDEVLQ